MADWVGDEGASVVGPNERWHALDKLEVRTWAAVEASRR